MNREAIQLNDSSAKAERALLHTLSTDLALPLLQIKTTLELLESTVLIPSKAKHHLQQLSLSADSGLRLAEAYNLALAADRSMQLPLEPVAMGAVLQEVAHELEPYANQYSTKIEVEVSHRLNLVLANKSALTAAFECLSFSLIRAQSSSANKKQKPLLVLGARRARDGFVTSGVFTNIQGISSASLKAARRLQGRAHQPLTSAPSGTASGILIADMLFSAMWQPLRSIRHNQLSGLVSVFSESKQLQFI